MARETLYVANIHDDIGADDIEALFAEFGPVTSVELTRNEKFDVPVALVTMETEKAATRANQSLNGHDINGKRLAVSYPEPLNDVIERGLSKKARKTAEAVCKELGEDIRKPVRRIHTMVLLLGHSFVTALVEEAKDVYAGEGMLTSDGSRKRSLGGVFFRLSLPRMSVPMYRIIHNRGGKLYTYDKLDDRAIYHLITNPHEFDLEYYNQVHRG
jgi:RNA recognition motif-containing protein